MTPTAEAQFTVVEGTWTNNTSGGFNGSQRTAPAYNMSNKATVHWNFPASDLSGLDVGVYVTWSGRAGQWRGRWSTWFCGGASGRGVNGAQTARLNGSGGVSW